MVVVEPRYCHQCGRELTAREFDGRQRAYCPEYDEEPTDAAVRELREETGYRLDPGDLSPFTSEIGRASCRERV